MKLGVFLPNGQNGYVVSNSSPQYVPTYQHMLDITKECERIGLDFILSMIKYRGFGGTSGYWESCLDSITLACGLAAHTSTIQLYATVPVLGIHPAVAARQISTFNDISKGRAPASISSPAGTGRNINKWACGPAMTITTGATNTPRNISR
jgi:pyrimidine oxygenase